MYIVWIMERVSLKYFPDLSDLGLAMNVQFQRRINKLTINCRLTWNQHFNRLPKTYLKSIIWKSFAFCQRNTGRWFSVILRYTETGSQNYDRCFLDACEWIFKNPEKMTEIKTALHFINQRLNSDHWPLRMLYGSKRRKKNRSCPTRGPMDIWCSDLKKSPLFY